MKYRRLSNEELKQLEPDFIRFLAANSIPGPDWEKIKTNKPEQAHALIDQFSDVVMEKVLENLKYLEFKSAKDIKLFYCGKEKMVLRGLQISGDAAIDLRQSIPADELMTKLQSSNSKIETYTAEKAYAKERKMELFTMLENGCLISDGKLFEVLRDLK